MHSKSISFKISWSFINGRCGIIGADTRPFRRHKRRVDVTGIARHRLNGLPLCDCSAKPCTHPGYVIGRFQNYASYGKDRTIHSAGQIESSSEESASRSELEMEWPSSSGGSGSAVPLLLFSKRQWSGQYGGARATSEAIKI